MQGFASFLSSTCQLQHKVLQERLHAEKLNSDYSDGDINTIEELDSQRDINSDGWQKYLTWLEYPVKIHGVPKKVSSLVSETEEGTYFFGTPWIFGIMVISHLQRGGLYRRVCA